MSDDFIYFDSGRAPRHAEGSSRTFRADDVPSPDALVGGGGLFRIRTAAPALEREIEQRDEDAASEEPEWPANDADRVILSLHDVANALAAIGAQLAMKNKGAWLP